MSTTPQAATLQEANSKGQGSKPQCPDSIPVGKDGSWSEALGIETKITYEPIETLLFVYYIQVNVGRKDLQIIAVCFYFSITQCPH